MAFSVASSVTPAISAIASSISVATAVSVATYGASAARGGRTAARNAAALPSAGREVLTTRLAGATGAECQRRCAAEDPDMEHTSPDKHLHVDRVVDR